MKKLLYAKDSEEFWQIFNEEREKRRNKLAKLPFAKKVVILEKMQADMTLLRNSHGAKGDSPRNTLHKETPHAQGHSPQIRR